MAEEARHAAGSVMFGQPIGRKDKWKTRIARWRETIFVTREPIHGRIGVARIKRVLHRRLERFVMRRHRAVLQTFRHMQPAKPVLVRNERRVARNAIQSALVSRWPKRWRLVGWKIGDVDAAPFALRLVPPNQFLALAPWLTGWFRARSIIYNATIGRPDEAPAVAKIILRIARVRLVDFIRAEHAGVNPAAACGRTVGFQFSKSVNLWAVMRVPTAIESEHDSFCLGLRFGVPTVDLRQDRFHFRIAQFVFRIPPVQSAQRFVERIG